MTAVEPQQPGARVVTVVLNYRHVEDTVRCVDALLKSDFRDQQILVVDNARDGPTTAALRDQLTTEVEVLASGDNLGYAGGNNFGIRWALPTRPEFIWLVNPDTVAKPNTLSGLVRAAEGHSDTGLVGCRMLQGDTRPARIESNGGSIDPARWGAAQKLDVGRFDGEVLRSGVRDVDWVSGACLLLRSAVIHDAGMLPEEYFLYYEDTEYCRRVRQAGWRTVVTQGTRMWHFRRSSNDLPSASHVYYLLRNGVHFGMKHFDASVEAVADEYEGFVQRWRAQVIRHAPSMLETYDDLVRRALDDARAGRQGRVDDIDSIRFRPDTGAHGGEAERMRELLEEQRQQAARDARRLLRRIKEDAAGLNRAHQLEHELARLRTSRSYRFARVVSAAAHPIPSLRTRMRRKAHPRRDAS